MGFCRFPLNYTLLAFSTASADLNLWICIHLLSNQKRVYMNIYLTSPLQQYMVSNLIQHNLKYTTLTTERAKNYIK